MLIQTVQTIARFSDAVLLTSVPVFLPVLDQSKDRTLQH